MRWLRRRMKAIKPPDQYVERNKDVDWKVLKTAMDSEIEATNLQVLMDLRDELKAVNKKLDKMDEHFRIVFGVEEKDED